MAIEPGRMRPWRMDDRLLRYAERPAPRYTSYPTAAHFTPKVTGETMAAWLGALDSGTPLSLYIHVPYCRTLCHYCACHTFAVRRDGPLATYVEILLAEVDRIAAATPARMIRAIHWGGGTPNLLSPERFQRIVSHIGERFDITGLHAHAIEIDPRELTPAHARAYALAGVTRASLGVQDLNTHVQAAIGRIQPEETVRAAADMLRTAGVESLNIDLMYGLPQQSVEDARASVRAALALAPDRLAIFGYAHVPWFKTRQQLIDARTLPDAATRFAQAEAVRTEALAAGYQTIGFDHFARPDDPLAIAARGGALRRNFQGYVDDDCAALIGIGPSAISTLPQGYAQNAPGVTPWARAIVGGGLATERGRPLTEDDRTRRALIEALLCDFEVHLDDYGGVERYGADLTRLAPLAHDALVAVEGDRVSIPEPARPFARLVAQAFDAYEAARHSASV